MIKIGKKTTVSENFTKLAAQYEDFQKKINELYTRLNGEEDGLICQDIRTAQDDLRKQQRALEPDIFKEFYRMFDMKCVKISESNGREPKWLYIDNVTIKKCAENEKIDWADIKLGDDYYTVTADRCKCIKQNKDLETYIRENKISFSSFMILGKSYRVTAIPYTEFDKIYTAAITEEEEKKIHDAAGYELYGYMPTEKLKATKEYKELSNFVKTAKLRENLALLKIDSLALKDNKKIKMKAAKDKKTKTMVKKAFDLMIEKVDKKIEVKENEIAKRCGKTK